MFRFLPGLLALAVLAQVAGTVVAFDGAISAFIALRADLLVAPVQARDSFCATPPPSSVCTLELARGQGALAQAACMSAWEPGPARYYTLRLRCVLPKWAGSLPLPLLEARLIR